MRRIYAQYLGGRALASFGQDEHFEKDEWKKNPT